MRTHLVFLSGFLGQKEDFSFLPLSGEYYPIVPCVSQEAWSSSFCDYSRGISRPRALIAYSLGGRLALTALKQDPALYDQVILISTHPGLEKEEEKKTRLKEDCKWAELFLTLPWDVLMARWNCQPVLASHPVLRNEADYCRKDLSEMLRNYSLGNQDFSNVRREIHHLIGEEDTKIVPFAPLFQSHIVQNAGHRLMWQQPDLVSQKILEIL